MRAYCRDCGGTCPPTGCLKAPFMWGFDGCLLKARLNGIDVAPLDLCKWLYCHETDTKMQLVPNGDDSYIEYFSERDINGCETGVKTETDKIYICDLLGLGKLSCLGDVNIDNPQACDLLVYHPFCGDADCDDCNIDKKNKWVNYHIPDAGTCVLEPDSEGYYHVLVKDDCGCIRECRLKNTSDAYQYVLRDSVANDPDWPFTYLGYTENIQIELASHVPELFGKTDLEVDISYSWGIQRCALGQDTNFKSVAIPTFTGGVSDGYNNAIINQLVNLKPWGSWETNTSRKILVPKGKDLYLNHTVQLRDILGHVITGPLSGQQWNGVGQAQADSSRLHALTVTVKPVRRHMR